MIILKTTKRTEGQRPEALRNEGMIPAVCYGNGKETVSVFVPEKDFLKAFESAGETSTITLDMGAEKVAVLVHDIQRHAVTGVVTHVDFLIVDMKKEIEVSVPLEFTGISGAEKGGLGTVVKVLHEIEVKALPDKLPHSIVVDISALETLETKIHVSDLIIPSGVTVITHAEEVVALVAPFAEEKEETPIDLSSIEVVEKGKKEEEVVTE